jgi:hypothetical protein
MKAVIDSEFERLLSDASERPDAVRALRHADDVWRCVVAPTASEGERAAWEWLRAQLSDALLELWQPNERTHDPEALKRVPPERRNELAADAYLLALGGLNLFTVLATEARQEEAARRAVVESLRRVGELIAVNLRTLRSQSPTWADA